MALQKVDPPRLPEASPLYSRGWVNTFTNVLRLYFQRLSSTVDAIVGANGGQFIDKPYALVYSTVDQPIVAVNTAQVLTFPSTYLSNAVWVESGSEVHFSINGVYNFQFSGQLHSTSASAKQVWVWIRRGADDIGYSTHQYTLAGAGTHQAIGWNFNIDMQAGQYLSLVWASDSADMTIEFVAATGPHPGIPSAVLAVNFVAPLPATIPTPP